MDCLIFCCWNAGRFSKLSSEKLCTHVRLTQGAVPTLFNAWLPEDPFLHCIKVTTPKLLLVDSERFNILSSHVQVLKIPIITVRTINLDIGAGLLVKEWSKVMSAYSGCIKAWEEEPDALPDDDATVNFNFHQAK